MSILTCVSPNIILEEYPNDMSLTEDYPPFMWGTGFIVKDNANQLYYITAAHCLEKNKDPSKLYIPVKAESYTLEKMNDCFLFEYEFKASFNKDQSPIDLLILKVKEDELNDKEKEHVLSRAIQLQTICTLSEKWKKILSNTEKKFVVIGYPHCSDKNSCTDNKINASPEKFYGYYAGENTKSNMLKLDNITWEHNLDGFSGSPVFFVENEEKNSDGQYTLVGVSLTGSNKIVQFIDIRYVISSIDRYKKNLHDFKTKIMAYSPLSAQTWSVFSSFLVFKTLQKNEVLVRNGEISTHLYFVCQGALRAYFTDQNGEIYTKNLFLEQHFAGSIVSSLLEKPSEFTIDALEATTLLAIPYPKLKQLMNQYADLKDFYIAYLEKNWVIDKEPREIALVLESATTRYLKLQATYPHLDQRIAQQHIASHLGITPTQLSRIRKNLKKKT